MRTICTIILFTFTFSLPSQFSINLVTAQTKNRMSYSWHDNCPVPLDDLRLLTIDYWGYDDQIHEGEMVVHKKLAQETITIFKELLEHKFPIERMELVDTYKANDIASMQANNSSAFCCRENTTTPGTFSKHSYGTAIDINPKFNPYVRGELVLPPSSKPFLNRSLKGIPGFIDKESICYKIFTKYGWSWGGDFVGRTDYHHFEKDPVQVLG